MVAKKISSDRKRSRPVIKRHKTDVFKNNKLALGLVLIIIAIVAIAAIYIVYSSMTEDDMTEDENEVEIGNPIAIFNTTEGEITIELFLDKAPITAGNFRDLAKDGFFQ